MVVGEPILAQEILVVCHKEKASRTPVDLGIGGVWAKAMFSLMLSDLAEASDVAQLFADVNLDVMVEQNEGGLSLLAAWHRLGVASACCRGAGTGRCRNCLCP